MTSLPPTVRSLELALGSDVEEFVNVFLDDMLAMCKSSEEHLEHLEIDFNKFKQANLHVTYEKCEMENQI